MEPFQANAVTAGDPAFDPGFPREAPFARIGDLLHPLGGSLVDLVIPNDIGAGSEFKHGAMIDVNFYTLTRVRIAVVGDARS